MSRIEVRAEKVWFTNQIEIAVMQRFDDGRAAVAQPLTMTTLEEGAIIPHATFSLSFEEAQTMIDELWRCGLRPTEGTGSAGAMAATERHLKDMQRIAIGLLKKHGV